MLWVNRFFPVSPSCSGSLEVACLCAFSIPRNTEWLFGFGSFVCMWCAHNLLEFAHLVCYTSRMTQAQRGSTRELGQRRAKRWIRSVNHYPATNVCARLFISQNKCIHEHWRAWSRNQNRTAFSSLGRKCFIWILEIIWAKMWIEKGECKWD